MSQLTIKLGDEDDQLLERLAQAKGVTKSELIRRSLSSYVRLSGETAKGRKVAIMDKDDKILKEIVLP